MSYDPDFGEDLTPPNLTLLDKLTVADPIAVSLHGRDEITGPLSALPTAASTETVTFGLARPADPAAQPIDPMGEPPAPGEETDMPA